MPTLSQILGLTTAAPCVPCLLAPMAGITDLPFRLMCEMYGCRFSYSEMISAKGLSYNNKNTHRLLDGAEKTFGRFGVQIFGHEPELMGEITEKLCETYPDLSIVDINMGCPAPKIVNDGNGSALMKDLPLASRIISCVAEAAAKYNKPVSVKFRKGFNDASINAVEFARMAENSGASVITVHGRTRAQMYAGVADREIIAQVKRAVTIPVIANGDIFSGESALDMLKITGADGIMLARGTQGNPFLFQEVHAALNNLPYTPPTSETRLLTALKHAEMHVELKGNSAFTELRKHLAWYTKSIRGASSARQEINFCETLDDVRRVFDKLLCLQK